MIKISLNRDSDKPLYAQIRDSLKEAVAEGRLNIGDRLPACTVFAKELGVTPSTIKRALEDLSASGLTECHVGRGTFIADMKKNTPDPPETVKSSSRKKPDINSDPEFSLAARRLRMGIAKSLDALLPLSKRPGLINFTSGIPDPGLIEKDVLHKLTNEALLKGQEIYQNYGDPMGLLPLRKALAQRFSKRGFTVEPDQILITSGSQQGASLMAQYSLENRYRILCETPCYTGIPNAFGALGHWVESVVRDKNGPVPERLDRFSDGASSVFYVCPELHNPMGTDMSSESRKYVSQWAQKQNSLIIADEIFHDLHFKTPKTKSILQEAGPDHAVIIGSFSKSFMCGLRIGWLISSKKRVRSLIALKRAMDIGTPPLMQGIVLAMLDSGTYDKHLPKAREHYMKRRDVLLKVLNSRMPEQVTWTIPQGGFHLWMELPEGYSSIALFLSGIERGVSIIPGPYCDIDHRFINALRLSYGSLSLEQITEGIELLSEAVEELLESPPRDHGLSGLGDFL